MLWKEIDYIITGTYDLVKQRNELLPLLMNGQVTVNQPQA